MKKRSQEHLHLSEALSSTTGLAFLFCVIMSRGVITITTVKRRIELSQCNRMKLLLTVDP